MAPFAASGSPVSVTKRRPSGWLFWAVKQKGIPPGPKLVLVQLADLADEHGRSYPGHQYLADLCGCSRRSIIDYLKHLVAGGWVTIENRTTAGLKTSNVYTLHNVQILHNARCANSAWGSADSAQGGSANSAHNTPTLSTRPYTQPKSTRSSSIRDDLTDDSWAK